MALHEQIDVMDDIIFETRKKIPEIVDYLDDTVDKFPFFDYSISNEFKVNDITDALQRELPNSSIEKQKNAFIKDIVRLSELFFSRTSSNKIRVKIEVEKSDRCRLFHVDNYRQRLLCTYLGPGTEWLDNENVRREGLGRGCNTSIVKDFDKINRAEEFQVLLLKGLKYGRKEQGVVHRSPPVTQQGDTRIILLIDECDLD